MKKTIDRIVDAIVNAIARFKQKMEKSVADKGTTPSTINQKKFSTIFEDVVIAISCIVLLGIAAYSAAHRKYDGAVVFIGITSIVALSYVAKRKDEALQAATQGSDPLTIVVIWFDKSYQAIVKDGDPSLLGKGQTVAEAIGVLLLSNQGTFSIAEIKTGWKCTCGWEGLHPNRHKGHRRCPECGAYNNLTAPTAIQHSNKIS